MISDRIKLARRKAGLSLRDLAAAMNDRVTAQAIGKYERNEDIPSSGVLIALAKALKVSVGYTLTAGTAATAGMAGLTYNSAFGTTTAASNNNVYSPRQLQLAARLHF